MLSMKLCLPFYAEHGTLLTFMLSMKRERIHNATQAAGPTLFTLKGSARTVFCEVDQNRFCVGSARTVYM